MTGLGAALGGSFLLAAISTLGDLVWATWLHEHRPAYGLVHGTGLFLVMGGYLGWLSGRLVAGAVAGAAIGAAAAGSFYVLAPFAGYPSMFVVWIAVWIALAVLYGQFAGGSTPLSRVLGRGILAAVASGLAFYAISGIWRPFDPAGWDYTIHFAAWVLAYFPGFAALLTSTRGLDGARVR